jgi:NAD(P)-dependent dehydrogenase (short-subunit alcohol dehydrogenase family)
MNSAVGAPVVIPGGAGGIGSAVTLELARRGLTVIVVDNDRPRVDAVIDAVTAEGGNARGIVADLLAFDSVEEVLGEALSASSAEPLAGLCYLAGLTRLRSAFELSPAEFSETLTHNLTAQLVWSQAAARRMQSSGGSIVLIASVLAFGGMPRRASYASSRGGVVQLVRTLATEWAEYQIRVNAVAPGWVETETVRNLGLDLDRFARRAPMKRLGTPEDIAGPINFLLSEDSRWVTGVTLPVDGGVLAYVGPGDPGTA